MAGVEGCQNCAKVNGLCYPHWLEAGQPRTGSAPSVAARTDAEARVVALEAGLKQIDGMSFDMRPGQMIEIRRVARALLTPEAGATK